MGIKVGQLPQDDRWSDPLVRHPELDPDLGLPLRNGCHDPPPHFAPRHHQVQRGGHCGGGQGGDGVEARARRCVPETRVLHVPGCLCRLGHAGPWNVGGDAHLRLTRIPVARTPGQSPAVNDAPLHTHGCACRVHIFAIVQGIRGGRGPLEEDHILDGVHVPRDLLQHILLVEPGHLGPEVLWGRALHHDVCAARAVVRRLCALGLLWRLRGFQERGHGDAGAHASDPEGDP
mmetsp:Transcript_67175/g.143759  ORF Transcript_67175/g.143759 Transcript_67175/m.143759 type:complete len:232 (+) Transcript_67175:786-1481(+)